MATFQTSMLNYQRCIVKHLTLGSPLKKSKKRKAKNRWGIEAAMNQWLKRFSWQDANEDTKLEEKPVKKPPAKPQGRRLPLWSSQDVFARLCNDTNIFERQWFCMVLPPTTALVGQVLLQVQPVEGLNSGVLKEAKQVVEDIRSDRQKVFNLAVQNFFRAQSKIKRHAVSLNTFYFGFDSFCKCHNLLGVLNIWCFWCETHHSQACELWMGRRSFRRSKDWPSRNAKAQQISKNHMKRWLKVVLDCSGLFALLCIHGLGYLRWCRSHGRLLKQSFLSGECRSLCAAVERPGESFWTGRHPAASEASNGSVCRWMPLRVGADAKCRWQQVTQGCWSIELLTKR